MTKVYIKQPILELTALDVEKFFLKSRNYFTPYLPPYFDFTEILDEVKQKMKGRALAEFYNSETKMEEVEGVNFVLAESKDANYAWREFRMIHPAVYVELVRILTENWGLVQERMKLFQMQDLVAEASILPGVSTGKNSTGAAILKWWHGMERANVKMSLYYNYVAETDILECYSSMKTDLLKRVLDGKAKTGVGERIHRLLTASEQGKIKGIPQGSMLGDFLAEMILSYIDVVFYNKIKKQKLKNDFTVIRYRDDYRIFTKDEESARRLLKILSDVLGQFDLKLNPAKTRILDDVIEAARKPDKKYWEAHKMQMDGKYEQNILKCLMNIYEMAKLYPNSGSVKRALLDLYENRIIKLEHRPDNAYQILGIMANMIVENPRSYENCVAVMSKIMSFNPGISRNSLVENVLVKLGERPNAEHLEICLQRLTIKNKPGKKYRNNFSKNIYDSNAKIWNSKWLNFRLEDRKVYSRKRVREMDFAVPVEEISAFYDYDNDDEDDFEEFWMN
ncbi:RNA-directed DNA polymerase [Candidatus Saccharibacteria bacterium]|nr:RNA-directed DNA polymerase [Candidatus Saccharibacteria bacterium]